MHGREDGLGWWRVVVAGAEVDDVHPGLEEPALDRRNLGKWIARQRLQPVTETDHDDSCAAM